MVKADAGVVCSGMQGNLDQLKAGQRRWVAGQQAGGKLVVLQAWLRVLLHGGQLGKRGVTSTQEHARLEAFMSPLVPQGFGAWMKVLEPEHPELLACGELGIKLCRRSSK